MIDIGAFIESARIVKGRKQRDNGDICCGQLGENSLEGSFCVDALTEVLSRQRPTIFNTDQGVQFTSRLFTSRLEAAGVSISMDGKGRALDNVFVERLWWSLKYEHIYLHAHRTVQSLHQDKKRG